MASDRVRPDRTSAFALGEPAEHLERGGQLGVAVGEGEFRVDDQRVAVLDEQVPRVAQLPVLLPLR